MALQSGELVGQYRIVSQFGQGGMATVYKAYHPQLERNVAIKFLQQSYVDDVNFLSRFEREAKIIASLDHPNIVPIYDFNYYKGQPYLVMKLIEGVTLKEIMANNEIPRSQILDMLTAVASGLTYAHERHILHRDIKPSNILVDADNRPYITDFGLARMTQASQSTLSQDMLMGTPHYMSPEQAKGSDELTPATDIYSLGVILYEFAVGRVPFSGNTPYAIVHDHIYTPLPLPHEVNPNVSPAVENILVRALAKSPSDRYPSAVEMLGAFKEAFATTTAKQSSQPAAIPSYTVGTLPNSAGSTPSKNKNRWWIAAAILLVLVAVIVGAFIINGNNIPTTEAALPTFASLSTNTSAALITETAESTALPSLSSDLSVAQTAVANDPNNPDVYIALAKEAWQQNQSDAAQKALEDGLAIAPDQISYFLKAAETAQNVNRPNPAVYLYLRALALAQTTSTNTQTVRAQVGQALYTMAQTPDQINVREIERQNNATKDFQPPALFDIMAVQLLVVQKRLPLAQVTYNRLSDATSKLPEAYLVHGELLQAQGNRDKAKKEWDSALKITDSPQWVMDRVNQLLQSN